MRVRTNGINTSCETFGEGDKPWVVLSHSVACRQEMWQPQIEALTSRFRVLTYDVRGHGQSDAPDGPYSMAMYAADVDALLAELGIDSCHFVGLSMGGMIGQVYALTPGTRVRSLVLADTLGRWPADMLPMWQERKRSAETEGMVPFAGPAVGRWFTPPFHAAHPETIKEVYSWIVTTPVAGFLGACHAIPAVDTLALLPSLTIPVTVVVGAEDPGTPPALSHELHRALPGSTLHEIPGAAHLSNMEAPKAFNDILMDFYARI